jgi:hypothetical protein
MIPSEPSTYLRIILGERERERDREIDRTRARCTACGRRLVLRNERPRTHCSQACISCCCRLQNSATPHPRPTPPTPTPPPPPAAPSPIPYTIPICRGVNSIAKQAYQPGAKAPRMPVRPAIRERVGQPLRGPAKSRGGGNKKGGGRVMAPDTRSE